MNLKGLPRRIGKKPTLEWVLVFYDAWLREGDESKVAAALDVRLETLRSWLNSKPEFKLAKEMADQRRGTRDTFQGYIFQHLSPEAKEIWDKLQFWQETSSYERINVILGGKPKRIRQELFIHALVSSNFSLSEACRISGVSYSQMDDWRRYDAEFRQLIEEIQWHKKNFFERALIDLVEERHPGATIFVNRTINADRGYTEKIQVEHSGNIGEGLSVDDLDLDLETKRKILAAIRKKKEQQTPLQIEAHEVHRE